MAVLLLMNLCASVCVSLYAISLAKREGGAAKICVLSIVGGLLSGLLFFVPVFLQFGLMLLGLLLLWPFVEVYRAWKDRSTLPLEQRARAAAAVWRHFLIGLAVAAPVLIYGSILCWQVLEWREFARLRQMYPLESIAARLDYEHKLGTVAKRAAAAAPSLSFATSTQLDQLDGRDSFHYRRSLQLQRLHEQTSYEFSVAEGFGPVRMISVKPRAENLFEADAGPISVEPPANGDRPAMADDSGSAADERRPAHVVAPQKDQLESLHWNGRDDFLNPDRFGYVRDRDHVAGFQSHRFTATPFSGDKSWQASWRLVRLELIGLLKYGMPKAYVSKYLPHLEQLGKAATRDVDAFEADALLRLQTREDIVIDQSPNKIRMVGSLRAGTSCIECHDVRRGELLGALTYEFVPKETKRTPDRPVGGVTVDWR